mmetsp:Transcript_55875/g.150702  ORF Transcript_55875/g.150702 Transcript_55875/m.150702 type:complete len:569 (-) Transcript_55875:63-1769(-)
MTMIQRPPRAPESPRHSKRISVRKKHALQLFKTDLCKLFQQGMCKHGELCAFAHNTDEVRHKPDLTRTSMCRVVLQGGVCRSPQCSFAHDKEQLRTTCGFFKTRMCNYARSGKCRSGAACRFAHAPEELRSLAPPEPEEGARRGLADESSCKLPASWRADGGAGGSSDSGSSRNSSAETQEQDPRRDRAGRRPPSSGSSSGYGAVSWASPVGPDSPGVPTPAAKGSRKGAPGGAQRDAAAGGRSAHEPRRHGQEPGSSSAAGTATLGVTSLKVNNVPRYMDQGALLSKFQELCPHIRDEIDFFYCPWDDSSGMNRGYVFMNFMDFQRANAFQYTWANKEIRQGDAMTRIRIQKAKPQGLVNSVKFFSDAGALNQELCHRPLVRDAGGTLKPLYAESFELPAGQGGSWLFGQPGSRGNGHAGARPAAGPEDAGGHGPAPGAGLCAWPTPQQGGLDYGVGAPLQPVWPVQAAGEAPDADAGGTVATAEGGQMLPGMEVAYMIMPMEYINSGYNSGYFPTMVVADPSGGASCTSDMAMGANWAPREAEVQPAAYQVPRWDLAQAEDEIYSD